MRLHFVLKEDDAPLPPSNASNFVAEEYNHWVVANNKAYFYLLDAMNELLRTKHEAFETTREIIDSLENVQAIYDQARHVVVKVVKNDKRKNGSSVREHVLKMFNHLNEAEINGVTIDDKTLVGMILETLSNIFPYLRKLLSNQKKCNLTELLNKP